MQVVDWWERGRRGWRFVRPVQSARAGPPLPPPLPPGRVVAVEGRGEMFLRQAPGPPGGPAILLLHGWVISADLNWWRLYEPVSRLGALVAVDHRGHGRGIWSNERFSLEAAADDAAALIRHLGVGPAVVCGYSMGGSIALLMARRHPDLVSGLVLEATCLDWGANLRERVVWKTMGLVELVSRLGASEGFVERVLRDAVERSPDLAPYQPWLKAELQRGDTIQFADAGRAMGDFDPSPFVGRIDVPTAVVVTTRDLLVPAAKQRVLCDALPAAEAFELDADHRACWLDPRGFQAVTMAALASVVERLAPAARPVPGPAG